MIPHGEYTIEVLGNVVHVFPKGGFNAQGIEKLHEDITSLAPKNQAWVLFEHPNNAAGLTPEAVEQITRSYQRLAKQNCIAVALEISSTWQGVFETSIVNKLDIPVLLNSQPDVLEAKIKVLLQENF